MTRTIYSARPAAVVPGALGEPARFIFLPLRCRSRWLLHRVFSLATPITLNIAAACLAGAALVLVMSAIAGLDIWVTGRQGAARIVVATVVACALQTIPLGLYIVSRKHPMLNDVTDQTSKIRLP